MKKMERATLDPSPFGQANRKVCCGASDRNTFRREGFNVMTGNPVEMFWVGKAPDTLGLAGFDSLESSLLEVEPFYGVLEPVEVKAKFKKISTQIYVSGENSSWSRGISNAFVAQKHSSSILEYHNEKNPVTGPISYESISLTGIAEIVTREDKATLVIRMVSKRHNWC